MMPRLGNRITNMVSQGCFSLLGLLGVIIIIGILLAIAIPSYLSFRGRAEKSAAQADVRASIPGVEAFYADHNTYSALTSAVLKASYDQGIKNMSVVRATSVSYCIESKVGQNTYRKGGPAADITSGAC
mgnify:CR=1 FL=1